MNRLFILTLILISLLLIINPSVNASYNATVSQISDSIQYIIVNKADAPTQTCCFWNPYLPNPNSIAQCDYKDDKGNIKSGRPQSCKLDDFENAIQEIRALIPVEQDRLVKLGVQMTIPYFNISSDQSEQMVRELIKVAEKEEMPIVLKLDGMTEWNNRSDLWNWFDPSLDGYDPANKENVEWFDWNQDAAIKISWRNWGQQERVRPAPNLGGPKYIEAKKDELRRLLPIIADWYNSLPAQKKYLLAAVILDNELSLWNHYFYPDGNKYYDLCPNYDGECMKRANDPNIPADGSNGPSFGRKEIGYAAVKSFSIKSTGLLTQQDVNEAVKKHAKILAETARAYLPADKIMVHGMWNLAGDNPARGPSYYNVVTDIAAPGWTIYGWGLQGFLYGTRFSKSSQELRDAIKQNPLKIWGAVEWSAKEPADVASTNTFPNWNNSLLQTLSSEGNKLIVVYSLHDIRNDKSIVVPAIQNMIKGALIDPNYVPREPDSQFNFTQEISECQTSIRGEVGPVVNLAWGKHKKALGYRVSKIETESDNLSGFSQQEIDKTDLKFTDRYVLPGRSYVYSVQAILPNTTNKPGITAIITVGACDKNKTDPTCQPYQKIIADQTGKKLCVDKSCDQRTTDICSSNDGKCMLVIKEGLQSCVVKILSGTAYIASFGPDIEATISSLCQSSLNNMGINLDDHLALCQQKAVDQTIGCLQAKDINELTGCIQRAAKMAVDELAPGYTQAAAAPLIQQPEGAIALEDKLVRTPIQIFLQSASGEIEIPLSGASVPFPTPNKENVIRLKIIYDRVDRFGSNEAFITWKVLRVTPAETVASCNPSDLEINPYTWTSEGMDCSSNDPAQRGQKWSCQDTVRFAYGENCPPIETTVVSNEPEYNESCWEFMENQCTGCGTSRSAERYTCEEPWFNQTRIKPGTDGQKDNLCISYISPTFFRYECTGCREARRVDKYCDGSTFVAQEHIQGIEECAHKCVEEIRTSCEIEDLAYYCERDNIAVYKYRDTVCQIQFSTVDCKQRGQICYEGDCVNE